MWIVRMISCVGESMTTLPGIVTVTAVRINPASTTINTTNMVQIKKRHHHRKLKAVKEEKKQIKKQLKALRKTGTQPDEVAALAQTFHNLVRQYSKLVKERK